MDPAAYISADSVDEIRPADAEAPTLPRKLKVKIGDKDEELPVSYWWKDAIQAGVYVHPKTGQKLIVDNDRIDRWVDTFRKMKAAGVEVPTPTAHDTKDASKNVGFVIAAKRVGNRLRLLTQTIGDDGALIAARNRCSIYIEPDYTDSQGRHWGDCFVHSAFTPRPVIDGQGEFLPFAASQGAAPAPVFQLSQGTAMIDFAKLRAALKAGSDVTDEQLVEQAAARVADLDAKLAKAETDKATALSQGVTLQNKLAGMAPKEPDEMAVALYRKTLANQRKAAVAAGAIDDATAGEIEKLFSDNGKPSGIALSVTPGSAGEPCLSRFWDIILGNKPTQVTTVQADGKSKTPAQGVQLSQGASGGHGANAAGSDAPKLDPTKPEDLAKIAKESVKQYRGLVWPGPKAANA